MLGLFKSKVFDFNEYLVKNLGYSIKDEYPQGSTFVNGEIEISVYKLKKTRGYDIVSVDLGSYNIASLKFIPKSKTMVDIMLNQIVYELRELQEKEAV